MTVKELIKLLNTMKQDTKVILMNEIGEEYRIAEVFPTGIGETVIGFDKNEEEE